jgi:SOS-response transcriptional repressor LexA
MISLQALIQYQLSEGLTEQELAKDIGVPTFTIHRILKGRNPKDLDIWKKLARYFRMDVNLLRFGKLGLAHSQENNEDGAGRHKPYRKVPLLSWAEASQVVAHHDSQAFLASRQRMIETELSGARVFAMHVADDSMEPLFHEGEIVFVNPDLRPQAGDNVVVVDQMAEADLGCLRQLKKIQERSVLHPLNSKYKDIRLTSHQKMIGRVVRLRMDL